MLDVLLKSTEIQQKPGLKPSSDVPESEISTPAPRTAPIDTEVDERDRGNDVLADHLPDIDELVGEERSDDKMNDQVIAPPAHVAGSGSIDHPIDRAGGYAEAAMAKNTNKAYKTTGL